MNICLERTISPNSSTLQYMHFIARDILRYIFPKNRIAGQRLPSMPTVPICIWLALSGL